MRTLLLLFLILLTGCIKYSFTGSTLPSYIKTVSIPLVDNNTSKMGLEETIHESVYNNFQKLNILQIIDNNANAELAIKILSYNNSAQDYDASGNITTYKVVIRAEVIFLDLKENEPLYENIIEGIGIYNHSTETEEIGIQTALQMLSETIINNTVSGW